MGTLTGQSIVDKALQVLQDTAAVRWLGAENLAWINEGQRYIALHRPDSSTETGNLTLVLGSKQTLPAVAQRLIDVVCNMGLNGTTPGAAIRPVERMDLDTLVPMWHAMTPVPVIKNWIYDNRDPKSLYVYPPSVASNQIRGVYAVAPAELANLAAAITLDDIYEPILVDYLIYRAQLKEAEYAGDPNRAMMHLNVVNVALGVKTVSDKAMTGAVRQR